MSTTEPGAIDPGACESGPDAERFAGGALLERITAPQKDLLGLQIYRPLPTARRRSVGPFVFLDQMGPMAFGAGRGLDIGAHPHIGLATVTYLFEGRLLHRDSLGTVQEIAPGEVNWMVAGRGIAHSERSLDREGGALLHGLQIWVALPDGQEDVEPRFQHVPESQVPTWEESGVRSSLVAGEWLGRRSPVATYSPMVELALEAVGGGRFRIPAAYPEQALYVADGLLTVDGLRLEAGELGVLRPGQEAEVEALCPVLALLIGGEPVGRRTVHWNFVSSRPDAIQAAREAWSAGAWPVPGESERMPLPEPA
jgi:redox-sensitive bicupin YhaK (pirin superfamily)